MYSYIYIPLIMLLSYLKDSLYRNAIATRIQRRSQTTQDNSVAKRNLRNQARAIEMADTEPPRLANQKPNHQELEGNAITPK